MPKAQIIEINRIGVGLAVSDIDEREFTFFSSGGLFDALDSVRFISLEELERAVRRLRNTKRTKLNVMTAAKSTRAVGVGIAA